MVYTLRDLKKAFNEAVEGLDDDMVVVRDSSNTMECSGVTESKYFSFSVEKMKKEETHCRDSFDGTSYKVEDYRHSKNGEDVLYVR